MKKRLVVIACIFAVASGLWAEHKNNFHMDLGANFNFVDEIHNNIDVPYKSETIGVHLGTFYKKKESNWNVLSNFSFEFLTSELVNNGNKWELTDLNTYDMYYKGAFDIGGTYSIIRNGHIDLSLGPVFRASVVAKEYASNKDLLNFDIALGIGANVGALIYLSDHTYIRCNYTFGYNPLLFTLNDNGSKYEGKFQYTTNLTNDVRIGLGFAF